MADPDGRVVGLVSITGGLADLDVTGDGVADSASSVDAIGLEQKVKNAIMNFEPRIVADTLQVELLVSAQQLDHHNQVSFKISGQIWAQPVPLELLLHTDVDLETGQVGIKDLTR